jgi:hypothetical protein
MLSVLVFALVILLLVADAVIFYVVGFTVGLEKSVQTLKKNGWTVEKAATVDSEDKDDAE